MTVLSLCDMSSQSRASVIVRIVCNVLALALIFMTAQSFMSSMKAYTLMATVVDPTLVLLCSVLNFVCITALLNSAYRLLPAQYQPVLCRNVAVSAALPCYALLLYFGFMG